jgi:hypothetical protein
LRLHATRRVEAHDDLFVFVVERRQPPTLLHVDLALKRVHERRDERRGAAPDAVHREHASAPAIAGFEQNRLRAALLQTIGSRQSGDAPADDGDRARSGLLGVSAPVQDGCERRRAGRRCGESQQLPPGQRRGSRSDHTVFMRGKGKSFLYYGE